MGGPFCWWCMKILESPIYVLWCTILLHLIADYNLQGILASLKQKRWWTDQLAKLPEPVLLEIVTKYKADPYRHDYIVGLICHSLMWSILTFSPFAFIVSPKVYSIAVIINTIIHAYIDDLKANKLSINLIVDQLAHLVQILSTGLILYKI